MTARSPATAQSSKTRCPQPQPQSSETHCVRGTGDFVEDVMEGNGLYAYGNGDMYEGSFKAGKRSGRGTYHYKVRLFWLQRPPAQQEK